MNSVEKILLQNIDNPNSCFIFPTDTAASRWADHLLRLRGGTVAMGKFIAWDIFKQNSIKSKVQNKKSIPSVLRKLFVSRLVKENAGLCAQGSPPLFSSLIRVQWAQQAAQFAPWLTRILPQLGVWFNKTTGLKVDFILSDDAAQAAAKLEGDDKDLCVLAMRYAHFLNGHGLFEPAWETPPFTETGSEYFIFFPESLSDYSEYKELLSASNHVKITGAIETENSPSETFFYTNSRSEITEASLYIRALHENGIAWDTIAVCIPDSENYEPYVLREFTNRNIPFVKRSSKPLTDYPAGQFFRAVLDCVSRDFSFSSFVSLVLNKNLPWKDIEDIDNLIKFGIKNNCISSWSESSSSEDSQGGKENINVWEDAFEQPFGGIDPQSRKFFSGLKRRLHALRTASSFAEVRRQYFIFRESFFAMEKCSDETDLILSRCISELMYLTEIEKDYPNVSAADPFQFFTEYLGEVNYLAQTKDSGVTILPYKTAAAAPFDCHIVLGAGQKSLSVVYSHLDFLPRKKREELGISDEDASLSFISLHKYNSLKNSAFFCCEQSFSGFTIPHSKINAPPKPLMRYAPYHETDKKFSEDYYGAENALCLSISSGGNSQLFKLHENQKTGFDKWKNRRDQSSCKNWSTNKILQEIIRAQYANNPKFSGKYSVSASGMADYFYCSLKWLFKRVLNLENEQIETSLMSENLSGLLYHAALNLFLTELKEKKEELLMPIFSDRGPSLPTGYHSLLKNSVNKIFDNFPKIYPDERYQMSALTVRLLRAEKKYFLFNLENCLVGFLSFFAGCTVSGCEASYQAERGQFYLNGKVDCILKDPAGDYIIADFKLKQTPSRDDCTAEGEKKLSDFQLPMYITLAEENEKIKVHSALFFSILNLKPEVIIGAVQNIKTEAIIPKKEADRIMRNSEGYIRIFNEFNQKTEQFLKEITTGGFTVFNSKYNDCKGCEYRRICRTTYTINRENING